MAANFKLIEIKPQIFLLSFNNYYDLCMTFLRYQEYYESDSSKFRGKPFKLLDYMEWYSKKYGEGIFTYPKNWSGFNFPHNVIKEVHNLGIQDLNNYDSIMLDVYNHCSKLHDKFYIVGIVGKNYALNHEVAHAMFYLNSKYKKEMLKLIRHLDPEFKKQMHKVFKKMGYANKVYNDEIQAYLSTSDSLDFKRYFKNVIGIQVENKPFVEIFNKYY
jgi:hypothetical protein